MTKIKHISLTKPRGEKDKNHDRTTENSLPRNDSPKTERAVWLQNIHQVPKLVKVTVNRGLGEASQNAKALESSLNEIAIITGQKPVVTRAKKAIAGFKIRQGMPVGVMVTLRSRIVCTRFLID
jgi:ribosomal protein L5